MIVDVLFSPVQSTELCAIFAVSAPNPYTHLPLEDNSFQPRWIRGVSRVLLIMDRDTLTLDIAR
jgi:hypothetical protein